MTIECPVCGVWFEIDDKYVACPYCDTELIVTATARINEEEHGANIEST